MGRPGVAIDLWTVYAHPRDYPNGFVARLWNENQHTDTHVVAPTLSEVRALLPPGLHRLPRSPSDDACIVETWL